MKSVGVFGTILGLALFGLAPQEAVAQSGCTWQMRKLAPPAGVTQHQVQATDHTGGYSGRGYFENSGWRILYWKDGRVFDYGSSGYGSDRVVGQNRKGTIAGTSVTGLWGERAVSFRIRAGQREMLPALPGAENASSAVGIAENDDVYGTNLVWQGDRRVSVVVRWPHDRPDTVERVSGLPEDMRLVDVDHDGTLLVGKEITYPWPHLWRNGQLTRLPEAPDTQHGYATHITDGLVAGSLRLGSDSNRPAYWGRDGQPHVIPKGAMAEQINKNGLVVTSNSPSPYQVWRFGTFEGQLTDGAVVNTIGDDDSIGGATRNQDGTQAAAVWQCK